MGSEMCIRDSPFSSLTELLSTHPRNRFLSNPHSLLNCARRAQRKLLAWFQPPQTVSRPSRPKLDSSQKCRCFKLYSTRCHYQPLVRSKKTPPKTVWVLARLEIGSGQSGSGLRCLEPGQNFRKFNSDHFPIVKKSRW